MMVGTALFSKSPFGNFMGGGGKNKNKSGDEARLLGYGEMLDNDEDDSYYEEEIIEDDEDEYIEEVIEELSASASNIRDLRATQEQVDSMSLQNAKKYLMALPSAKGPTSAPTSYASDDDYEYEEIELPDTITPIRKSQRLSLFESPGLDAIVEGSEHSTASSVYSASASLASPATTRRKAKDTQLSNIQEGTELDSSLVEVDEAELPQLTYKTTKNTEPTSSNQSGEIGTKNQSPRAPPPPPSDSLDSKSRNSQSTAPRSHSPLDPDGKRLGDESQSKLQTEGAVSSGNRRGTRTSALPPSQHSPSSKPLPPPNRSNKSLQSSTTDTTLSDSNSSLDIRQVFSMDDPSSPGPASPAKERRSSRRQSSSRTSSHSGSDNNNNNNNNNHSRKDHHASSNNKSSKGSLGRLAELDMDNSGRRRRRDGDERSVGTSRSSRRHHASRRQSSRTSKPDSEERAKSVEKEIRQLLAPVTPDKRGSSLEAEANATQCTTPHSKDCSDEQSTSSRSNRTYKERSSTDKEHGGKRSESKSKEREKKHVHMDATAEKEKPPEPTQAPQNKAKTLDDLLARVPSAPAKRSDARSTVSALVRRGRHREDYRDTQSVTGGGSSGRSRARSARRTKRDNDAPKQDDSRRRARSSSIGRKERLRRTRRKEEVKWANREAGIESAESSTKPPSGSSSGRSKSRERERRSSSSQAAEPSDRRTSSSSNQQTSSRESKSRSGREAISRSGSGHLREERHVVKREYSRDGTPSLQRSTSGESKDSHGRVKSPHKSPSYLRRSTSSSSRDSPEAGKISSQILKMVDDKLDKMELNASFGRTLLLARSLHASDSEESEDDDEGNHKSPRKNDHCEAATSNSMTRTPSQRRSSVKGNGTSPRRQSSDFVRTTPGKSHSADGAKMKQELDSQNDNSGEARHSMPDVLKTPTGDRNSLDMSRRCNRPRTPNDDLTCPRTPSSRQSMTRSRSSRSSRTEKPTSSRSREAKPSSSSSRGSQPKTPRTPGGRRSTSSARAHSPSSSAVSKNTKSLSTSSIHSDMTSSVFGSQRTRRSSDMGMSGPPLMVDASSERALTPFERLSQLEKIKPFLTEDEYERKKQEILAAV